MTVSTQANKAQFNGAGTTGPFTFNFRFFNNSEIYAIKTSSTGVDTNLSESTDYTLTGSGSYSGGSLTLTSSLAVGEKLTVYRVLPLTQATDLRNQGAFFAEVHEDAFDKLTMQVQQIEEAIGRAVQVPITLEVSPDDYLYEMGSLKAGAEAAQTAAEAALDAFTDLYLGVKASDPTTDNDGNALQEGALYWNSTAHRMRVYETGAWTDVTVSSSFTVDTFSGTGAQTAFTLSANPGTKNNTVVTISGVYQQKATYSVSGTTLAFTTAPPSGTDNIEVCIASTVSLNIPADDSVSTAKIQDDAVTTYKLAANAVTPAKMSRAGTAGQVLTSGGDGADPSYQDVVAGHGECRLIKSGSNLLLQPYNGKKLIINSTTQTIPSAGVSLAPPATSGTTYYIYAYMNGSTMTLEASTTTHATDSTTGVEIKSGDATRTLVGMARTVSSAWVDTPTDRLVASWFNRSPRPMRAVSGAAQTGIGIAWVALTGTLLTMVNFSSAVNVSGQVSLTDPNAGAAGYVGIGLNGTSISTTKLALIGSGVFNTVGTSDALILPEGYNTLQLYAGGVNSSTQGAGYASLTGTLEG